MKKSEIYAAYNITYKNGKILAPSGDYIAPLLKKAIARRAPQCIPIHS